MIFSILKFWFSRLSRECKCKKWPKMAKIFVWSTLHFRNHISYDFHLLYICMYKWLISAGIFFIFFRILIFGIIRVEGKSLGGEVLVIKGQKMAQNDKKFCLSLRIPGTIHHMIVIFDTHELNDNISSKFFHFSKFWFLGFLER